MWNGVEYARNKESREGNPGASAWWAILITMAELLEAQECPLSTRQTKYIRETLFGGMGSLNDLRFDDKQLPAGASQINKQLEEQRAALFAAFTASDKDDVG